MHSIACVYCLLWNHLTHTRQTSTRVDTKKTPVYIKYYNKCNNALILFWLSGVVCDAVYREFTRIPVNERQSVHVYERRRHGTRSAAESTAKPHRRQIRGERTCRTVPWWAVDKVARTSFITPQSPGWLVSLSVSLLLYSKLRLEVLYNC